MKRLLASTLLTFLSSVILAISANARPLYNFDVKVDPKSIAPGAILDIPLYMVENRNADEPSLWEGGRIYAFYAIYKTGPSEVISFTPREEYDNDDSRIYIAPDKLGGNLDMQAEQSLYNERNVGGVPTEVDNSGITGRSETHLGTFRIKIGPEIQREDGNGNLGPVEIFQIFFGAPTGVDLPWNLKFTKGETVIQQGRVTYDNHVVILKSDVEEEPTPTPMPTASPIQPDPSPTPADTVISASQDLLDTIANSKILISQVKKKIQKKNREEQLSLRASLRELAQYLLDLISQSSADITTTSAKFNLTKASKKASRKLKLFASKKKKAFKKRKRLALKSLALIENKIVVE